MKAWAEIVKHSVVGIGCIGIGIYLIALELGGGSSEPMLQNGLIKGGVIIVAGVVLATIGLRLRHPRD
ncbi:hypothetical protein Pan216_53930 [Planctomycetes bacterium Pan216]|uniref:Uncharacterized protein n=1 Tax=Kolteria novifilia TaxID=2527975 RepID=A0A518BC83_9BACT|nr:hypothetical protein Pan216_53930 [Planctomycetes bacterium Pan216]